MSQTKKKSRKKDNPLPASGAGLVRYYDADLPGFKIGPYAIVIYIGVLIVGVLLAPLIFGQV